MKVNLQITTYVNPTDPGDAHRSVPWWLWLLAILIGIVILLLLILCLWKVSGLRSALRAYGNNAFVRLSVRFLQAQPTSGGKRSTQQRWRRGGVRALCLLGREHGLRAAQRLLARSPRRALVILSVRPILRHDRPEHGANCYLCLQIDNEVPKDV